MNRRRMAFLLALTAVVVLASLGWLIPMSKTCQAAPAPAADAAFKGKFLLVNTNHFVMPPFLLEKAQVQKIGEHSWLMGQSASDNPRMGGWYKGRTMRLQMDHIVSITEFDDLKDAKKALESVGGGFAPVALPASPAPPAPTEG